MKFKNIWMLLFIFLWLGTNSVKAETEGKIKIGLLPYLSPELLMSRYSPLVDYVGKSLNMTPLPETAPNFPSYVKRAEAYEYELYVTAPHFAALAEEELGYKRVARLTRELDGAMVVHVDSPIREVSELKGKTLATPDHLAIITILGEQALQKFGLDPENDVKIKSAPSHNTALIEVVEKRADAAVVSAAVYESMEPALKNKLRLIYSTDRVPHMMFLASPKIPDWEYKKLKSSLLNYTAEGDGKQFFKESGYVNMQPISEDDMSRMKTMLPLLKPRLD